MAETTTHPTQEAGVSTAECDIEHLKIWYQEYTDEKLSTQLKAYSSHAQIIEGVPLQTMGRYVEPVRKLCPDKAQEVDSDFLDAVYVQAQIQLSMSAVSISQGLCRSCSSLCNDWPDPQIHSRYRVEKARSTYAIEAATRHGCKFCAFLLYQLEAYKLLDRFRKIEKRLSLIEESTILYLNVGPKFETNDALRFDLSFPGNYKHPAFSFDGEIADGSDTLFVSLIDDIEVMNKWLSVCKYHARCNAVLDRSCKVERPSRLICITENAVKLVLTEQWETMPRYATLSYCWGGADFIKTTRDKLDAFLNDIPFESLPKTFQDAINISRRLGLEYIWIDALCIVQAQGGEHALDWYQESGRMGYIYGRSYLNIAASIGKSPHEGCHHTPLNYNAGFITQVKSGEVSRTMKFDHMEWQDYNILTTRTHLASRAWAFQERLLAPRTVYMTGQGLLWECISSVASSSFPEDISKPSSIPHMARPEGEAWSWYEVVRSYSNGRLTNHEDKLPALSGVAKRQHEVSGDTYLAGMWKATLKEHLGWCATSKGRRSDPRIPTWSWASLDANIWFGKHDVRHIEILDTQTTLKSADPFGEVLGGELRLRCAALVRGRYLAVSDELKNDRIVFETSSHKFPVDMDCVDDLVEVGGSVLLLPLVIGAIDTMRSGVQATHPKLEALYKRIKLHGKTIQNHRYGRPEIQLHDNTIGQKDDVEYLYQTDLHAGGLILQPVNSSTKDRFRRVGSFEFRYSIDHLLDEENKDYYHEFLDIMNKEGTEVARSVCEDIWTPPEQIDKCEAGPDMEDTAGGGMKSSDSMNGSLLEPGAENSAFSPDTVHPGARFIITIV